MVVLALVFNPISCAQMPFLKELSASFINSKFMKITKEIRARNTVESSFEVYTNSKSPINIRSLGVVCPNLMCQGNRVRVSRTALQCVTARLMASNVHWKDTVPGDGGDKTKDGCSHTILKSERPEISCSIRSFARFW